MFAQMVAVPRENIKHVAGHGDDIVPDPRHLMRVVGKRMEKVAPADHDRPIGHVFIHVGRIFIGKNIFRVIEHRKPKDHRH